jgi:uncharacterized protein (TIGR00369 family)
MALKLTAKQIEDVVRAGLPHMQDGMFAVEEVREGYARIRLPWQNWMLRPGPAISGPAQFTAADTAMFALVLAHIGPEVMAVTSDMTMHFVNRGKPGDVVAEARLLKMGRRLAVMDVLLFSAAEPGKLIAHVSGSYVLPPAKT